MSCVEKSSNTWADSTSRSEEPVRSPDLRACCSNVASPANSQSVAMKTTVAVGEAKRNPRLSRLQPNRASGLTRVTRCETADAVRWALFVPGVPLLCCGHPRLLLFQPYRAKLQPLIQPEGRTTNQLQ